MLVLSFAKDGTQLLFKETIPTNSWEDRVFKNDLAFHIKDRIGVQKGCRLLAPWGTNLYVSFLASIGRGFPCNSRI
jgi:hypothetical protein